MNTKDIRDALLARKREIQKEYSQVEKALVALEGETTQTKKQAKKPSAKPPEEGSGTAESPVTVDSVLELCKTEYCNAERVAVRLGGETSRAAAVLSRLFSQGKLERQGERGSYEYRVKPEATGFPHRDQPPS